MQAAGNCRIVAAGANAAAVVAFDASMAAAAAAAVVLVRKDTCHQSRLPCVVTSAVAVSSVWFAGDHSRCPVDECVDELFRSMNIHDVSEHIAHPPLNAIHDLSVSHIKVTAKFWQLSNATFASLHTGRLLEPFNF